VVRLGRDAASRVFAVIVALAYAGLATLPVTGAPPAILLASAGLPFGWRRPARLSAVPRATPRLVPAQAWTLVSFLLMAAGSALGLLLAG
jgi:1,4-dihydroxy-2-naphthoate octaprenyltransferase